MTVQTHLHNFPPQPTTFIGRESEIAELVSILEQPDCRLLTLVGSGGMGKTRLSLETAAHHAETFPHGIFFVPLAPLNSASDIVTTTISVLGIHIGDDGTLQEELIKFLSKRHLLLIMDNFEHVLDGADLVADILQNTSDVKILVTSREVLNLRLERVWQVKGLQFPENAQITNTDRYSALKLFLDRATWVRRDFDVDSELPCAVRICRMVSGIPLALELAASWLKTLTCSEVATEIQRSVDFLATRVRDVPERHRSMRAVFDHSWSLCDESERAVFMKLSVFRGGFERDAAEKVAGASLLTLSTLVEKSMVRKMPTGRYDIHELLRQYAEDRLRAAGEIDVTEEAHLRYFAHFMREHAIDIKGRRQLEGLNEIEYDFENVRTAWQRAVAKIDYDALGDMAEGLALYCDIRARHQVGEDLLYLAVEVLAPYDDEAIQSVWNRLRLHWLQTLVFQQRFPVPDNIHQQLADTQALAQEYSSAQIVAHCLWIRGEFLRLEHTNNRRLEAVQLYSLALEYFERHRAYYYVGRILGMTVFCYLLLATVEKQYQEKFIKTQKLQINVCRRNGNLHGLAYAVFYRAIQFVSENSFADVVNSIQEAINIWHAVGDIKRVGVAQSTMSIVVFLNGQFDKALELAHEAEQIASNVNYSNYFKITFGLIANLAGQYRECQQIFLNDSASEEMRDFLRSIVLAQMSYGLGKFDDARIYLLQSLKLWKYGKTETTVLIWPSVALLLAIDDENKLAVEVLSFAYSYPEDWTEWMRGWSLLHQLRYNLVTKLDKATYQAAWARGTQRNLETTINEFLAYFTDGETATLILVSQHLAEPLSERELEVLALLAEGMTNREIAEQLYIAVGTVRVHTRNIYSKLNVGNRTQAAAIGRDLNLI